MKRPVTAMPGGVAVIEAEADIRRPVEEVFDYACDPANEPGWNIRAKRIQKLNGGPVGVGARYRVEFTQAPAAISECVRFERPRLWEHVGGSKIISSVFSGQVVPWGEHSHLLLRMQIRPRGPLRLVLPLVRRRMQRELERDAVMIKDRLECAAQTATGPQRSQRVRKMTREKVAADFLPRALVGDALRLLGVLVTYPVSRRPVRPLAGEAMRSLPGDELVAGAKIRWNHAITIRAHPADIWPWLVQMGCRRAGWYSYDGLDNGGVPSAERIVPGLQRVQAGDIFPMTPKAQDRFVVRVVEPDRALVLGDDAGQMSWAFVLEPAGEMSTRVITRSRGTIDRLALGLMLNVFWHPLDFGMQRRQLLNLKRLVETA
jgi:hypothetical protein